MFVEALSKVFDRGKRPGFFLSSVPCLGKGSVLMGLHWLPAGQRVDFKMLSDALGLPLSLGFLHLRADT